MVAAVRVAHMPMSRMIVLGWVMVAFVAIIVVLIGGIVVFEAAN